MLGVVTSEQVADLVCISQSAYARIESGESHSWSSHIDEICKAFEISPEELVKTESVIVNSNQQGANSTNIIIINQLSVSLNIV